MKVSIITDGAMMALPPLIGYGSMVFPTSSSHLFSSRLRTFSLENISRDSRDESSLPSAVYQDPAWEADRVPLERDQAII